jgi:RNA polymerase primary sigma factor
MAKQTKKTETTTATKKTTKTTSSQKAKKVEKVEDVVETKPVDPVISDTDIVAPTKTTKKRKSKKDFTQLNDEKCSKKLDEAISKEKKKEIQEDIIDPIQEEDDDFLDDISDEELQNEIEETKSFNKGRKGANGEKISVTDMAHSDKELVTLDDIKEKLYQIGKKNKNIVKQEDIDKLTAHLKLSDDDINDIWVYLNDKGMSLNSEDDALEDDEIPQPYEDEDNFDEEDKEDEYDENEEMLASVDVKNSDPVRQYLHAIGTYQVFKSKDEEVVCAQSIIQGQEALAQLEPILAEAFAAYEKSSDKHDFNTFVTQELPSTEDYLDEDFNAIIREKYPMIEITDELYQLKEKVDAGTYSKNLLIQCNLKLVVSIAKHYVNRGMEFLDLIQEGNLGLMKAVDKFDYTRGFKFSTYATWWIRQAITRALADQARTIRIPVHMVETINKITRAQRKLVQKLNRDPTAEEISEELGGAWSASRIREIQQIALDPLSLEKPVGEEEDSHVGDFIEDKENISPYEYANRTLETERINEVLSQLTDRESRVIKLRYGLDDGRTHTLEEVGKEFNVTRERIRQIEAKALKKLRHPARAKLLKDFKNDY